MITPLVGADLGGVHPSDRRISDTLRLLITPLINIEGKRLGRLDYTPFASRYRAAGVCLIRLPRGGQIGGQNRSNAHNSLIYMNYLAEECSAISLFLVLFHCGQDLRQAIGAVTNVLSDFQFVSEFAP